MTQLDEPAPATVPGPVRRNLILVVMCLALVAVVGMMASLMVAVPHLASISARRRRSCCG
ncbi:hypothetical protein [Nocardia pneumoniae]|uniref:hypothetical protein n=1 Tax=Nocardia pneumoniae TaxID=228601 RepID=UPI00031CAB08|nr:hypothetical protein [Nocardia pneumoniae]